MAICCGCTTKAVKLNAPVSDFLSLLTASYFFFDPFSPLAVRPRALELRLLALATRGLTLEKVNQVNWLFCGRGFAQADVCIDSVGCLFIPCIHPCMFAAGFWVWDFS